MLCHSLFQLVDPRTCLIANIQYINDLWVVSAILRNVQIWCTLVNMGGDEQDRSIGGLHTNSIEPVVESALFSSQTGIPDDKVERPLGKKELMSRPINILTSEVPGIEL